MSDDSLTVEQRVSQIAEWLQSAFPPPYPVDIRWVRFIPLRREDLPATRAERRRGRDGEAWIAGRRCYIRLSRSALRRRFDAVEAIEHEWAHLIAAKAGKLERERASLHDDEYWLARGRIYRAFREDGGQAESKTF